VALLSSMAIRGTDDPRSTCASQAGPAGNNETAKLIREVVLVRCPSGSRNVACCFHTHMRCLSPSLTSLTTPPNAALFLSALFLCCCCWGCPSLHSRVTEERKQPIRKRRLLLYVCVLAASFSFCWLFCSSFPVTLDTWVELVFFFWSFPQEDVCRGGGRQSGDVDHRSLFHSVHRCELPVPFFF
jgi:hypothetical protein